MKEFLVIPVIDILNGLAVRAYKGLRNYYKPIINDLCPDSSVINLAKSFEIKYQTKNIYIADLDAILFQKVNINLLKNLKYCISSNILLDAGIRNIDDIHKIINIGVSKIILGTETIEGLNIINDAIKIIGSENIIVSIDMKNKEIISLNKDFINYSILELIEKMNNLNVNNFILLDLLKVGSKEGFHNIYNEVYDEIRKKFPNINLIIGGGVKSIHDLVLLRKKGMNGVLIATAFHDNLITQKELRDFLN